MTTKLKKYNIICIAMILLCAIGCIGVVSAAVDDSGTCGTNLTWVLTNDGTLTISGTGSMDDYAYGGAPWHSHTSQMTKLVLSDGITSIGDWAFEGCNRFTGSLILPTSVTSIGYNAFYECSNFSGSLIIPDSILLIESGAFYRCDGFNGSLTISNNITSIADSTFYKCTGFTGSLIIPNNVTSINNYAFSGCSGFTSVSIPSSVTSIGTNALNKLHSDSVIYTECTPSLLSGTYSTDKTALAAKATNNASTFTVDSTSFPSGFSLTSDNAPIKENCTFAGWYTTSSYSGSNVSTVTDGQTLYAKWIASGIIDFGTCGTNLTWVLTDDGTLTISGTGTMNDYTRISPNVDSSAPWSPYRLNITTLVLSNGITTIGDYAFFGCNFITGSLTIPKSVTIIGNSGFAYTSFSGSLTIPSNVTTIGDSAFYGCSGFTDSLTIPNSVTSIGNETFAYCIGFTGTLALSNNLTTIGDETFYECSGFTGNLTIPDSVTTIGNGTFYGCSGFTDSLTIPRNVMTIGSNTFSYSGITEIIVDSGNTNYTSDVQGILYNKAKSLLHTCPSGKTGSFITIPDSVTTIGDGAFTGCSGFTGSLTIPNNVTNIGGAAFYKCSNFTGSLTIPDSVTTIGLGAFYDCSGFTGSLTIPDGVTTISEQAFAGCSGFTGPLTIPNNVTTIGEGAFYRCSGITNVTIPSSVTTIGGYAFSNLHANSVIYAECSASLVSGTYSTDRTALAEKGTNNAYTFTVNSTSFPSGFSLTSDNSPEKTNVTFEGWYASSSYSGSKVTKVTNGQTLYAKWMAPTTHQLSAGWNVVSVPHKPTAAYDTVGELFTGVDTADHSIYVYNGKTKVWEPATSSTAISPLNAYWIYAASPTVISCLYDTSSSTLPSKTVYSGWNLVGISVPESISAATAFTSVDWLEYYEWNASTQGYNPTLVKGGSGTAADTNNVSIWNGGWLSMNTNGTYTGSV